MNLQDAITTNRAIVALAGELNLRAGETIFAVPSQDELTARFKNALLGAKRKADVADASVLVLPDLDQVKVDHVLADFPDTIRILGLDVPVIYRRGESPKVEINFRDDGRTRDWLRLPREGVFLPGGQEVMISSYFGEHRILFATGRSSDLVKEMAQKWNEETWNRWEQPRLQKPDLSDPQATVSLETYVYGQCVDTGEDLVAYGTLQFYESWGEVDSRIYWVTERCDAEFVQRQSNLLLDRHRGKLVAEAAAAEAKARAEAEAAAARTVKIDTGREQIKNVNVRRQKLGWEELVMRSEDFFFGSHIISYDDEAGLQEVETAVAREEERRRNQQPATSESLAALMNHFNN